MSVGRSRLPAALLLVALAWLVVYPLSLVLLESVRGPEGFTVDYLRQFLSRAGDWEALWGSLWISIASVILSAAIGIPLAFLFWRYEFPGRRWLGVLVAQPVVLPPLVGVIAFLFLYGESGFVARLMQQVLGLDQPPWRLQGG